MQADDGIAGPTSAAGKSAIRAIPTPRDGIASSCLRYMMSLRAELLRLSMKAWKLSKSKRRHISMAKVRSRLRLIEPIVPQTPSGTKSSAIDVDGIKAIEILVPEARTDRHVLYFHGG